MGCRPKISNPTSARKLATVQKKMGTELPKEFREVLLKYSSRVEFFWYEDEESSTVLPENLSEVCTGGSAPLWDINNLVEFAQAALNHATSPWLAFREGLRDRLPFMNVGNGDVIAFDMRAGTSNCPIVYLSHENDANSHNRQLGDNFIDFITRWSYLGCPGPEFWLMQPFYAKRAKVLNEKGRAAERWRKWLVTGR